MKKIIALLLALTCALALFAGCAAKTTSNDTAADTSAADTAAKDDSASTEKEDKQDDAASTKKELSGILAAGLPSTSPANAAWTLNRLVSVWNVIRTELEK